MKIGLIDVDSHNYPNLVLMKISAYHKGRGDDADWYQPLTGGHYDRVYMSKVFSFSPDYEWAIDADEILMGGTGYCISVENGKEKYDKTKDWQLPYEIEHIYPDYELYGITETAYGFMSRGCPRGCDFCHVASKEGKASHKVADLSEFWRGQNHIELMDANTLACKDWKDILQQLIDSKSKVNFNQGLDIRLMTEEKAEMLSQIKIDKIHFAWDKYSDKDMIIPKFETFRKHSKIGSHNLQVYVLCGFDTTMEQNLERIYWLRDNGYAPFVMLYNKETIPKGDPLRHLQRWVNNRFLFWSVKKFEDYKV